MTWRTLDTAPKDGTIVLGCEERDGEYRVFEMAWMYAGTWGWRWSDPMWDGSYDPTHWMPRPLAPSGKEIIAKGYNWDADLPKAPVSDDDL